MLDPLLLPGDVIHEWTLSNKDRIGVVSGPYRDLVDAFVSRSEGNILQIGSRSSILDKNYKWRNTFDGQNFIGSDLAAGENVDVVLDITDKLSRLRAASPVKQFDAIICAHVLEHVKNPFLAADNLSKMLKKGGLLYVSVPWVQGYHDFPNDYWRFSFPGLRELFSGLDVFAEAYAGSREDTYYQLTLNGKPEHTERTCRIERNLFQFLMEEMPAQPMFTDFEGDKIQLSRQYMPATVITTIFRKS